MARKAKIYMFEEFAGILEETNEGKYIFTYENKYLETSNPMAVSLTLPLRHQPYVSTILFPFFDGLIPEGWLLQQTVKNWKINAKDRMGLLLNSCADCIGAEKVLPYE